jgi:uncharacterized protein YcfJ
VNHRRAILALFALAALIAGTAGYTTIQAERSVDVAVADEGEAFLAVEAVSPPPEVENGSAEPAFEVTNQLGRQVDLTVRESYADGSVGLGAVAGGERETTIDHGNSKNVTARCTGTTDGTLEVTVRAESDDGEVSVRIVRSTDVTCT